MQRHPIPPPALCPLRDTQNIVSAPIATPWGGNNVELQLQDGGKFGRLRSDCMIDHGRFGSEYPALSTQLFGFGGYATTGENPDGHTADLGCCDANFATDLCRSDRAAAADRGAAAPPGGAAPDHGASVADAEPGGCQRPELAPSATRAALIDDPEEEDPEIEAEPITEDYLNYLDWRRDQDERL